MRIRFLLLNLQPLFTPPAMRPLAAAGPSAATAPSSARKRRAEGTPGEQEPAATRMRPVTAAAAPPSAARIPGKDEIIQYLHSMGPVSIKQVVEHFKDSVPRDRRTDFQKLLQGLVRLEEVPPGSGTKLCVLKAPYRGQ